MTLGALGSAWPMRGLLPPPNPALKRTGHSPSSRQAWGGTAMARGLLRPLAS